MTERLAWLLDANVVSEMMRPRPEPRVAAFLDSIAEESVFHASIPPAKFSTGSVCAVPDGGATTLPGGTPSNPSRILDVVASRLR